MPKHRPAKYTLPDELPGQYCVVKNQWHYHIIRVKDMAKEWYLDKGWAVSTGCMLPKHPLGCGFPPGIFEEENGRFLIDILED